MSKSLQTCVAWSSWKEENLANLPSVVYYLSMSHHGFWHTGFLPGGLKPPVFCYESHFLISFITINQWWTKSVLFVKTGRNVKRIEKWTTKRIFKMLMSHNNIIHTAGQWSKDFIKLWRLGNMSSGINPTPPECIVYLLVFLWSIKSEKGWIFSFPTSIKSIEERIQPVKAPKCLPICLFYTRKYSFLLVSVFRSAIYFYWIKWFHSSSVIPSNIFRTIFVTPYQEGTKK